MFRRMQLSIVVGFLILNSWSAIARAGQAEDHQEYHRLITRVLPELNDGQYAQVENDSNRMLVICQRSFPDNTVMIVAAQGFLAMAYDHQGRFAGAEALYQWILPTWERVNGPNHATVGEALNNLGLVYWHQGRFSDAEPLLQRAIQIWQQQMGPNHPDLATMVNNLANIQVEQGKYIQAEPNYRRAIQIAEANFGPNHPAVATPLSNLAILYLDLKDLKQAEQLHQHTCVSGNRPSGRTIRNWPNR